MLLTVVIPNYNGLSHLHDCLGSLRTQSVKDFKIVVVDNNSADDSVEFIKTNYSECDILTQDKNYGFAKSVNIGIRYSINQYSPLYIVLLNNDIECDKHFLEELVNGFTESNIGSVSSKMMNFYERKIIDDTGNFINLKQLPYARGQKEKDAGQYDTQQLIFGACAGASIYKREIFDTVGYFDEDFISYFEDVDLSFRLQRYGYKCFYNPKAICYHKRGATSLKNIPYNRFLIEKNLIALRVKNYPGSILRKYFFKYLIFFHISLYRDLRWFSIKTAVYSAAGFLKGLFEIFKSIKKRKEILKNTIVSDGYLINVCSE